jgi:hypothetical protein
MAVYLHRYKTDIAINCVDLIFLRRVGGANLRPPTVDGTLRGDV